MQNSAELSLARYALAAALWPKAIRATLRSLWPKAIRDAVHASNNPADADAAAL